MEPNIQNKLANLEMAPPPGSWQHLSVRMDAEYDQTEVKLAQRLDDATLVPPAGAWVSIAENLAFEPSTTEETAPARKPARVIKFPFRKVAVAAAVLILISYSGWYFFRPATGNPATAEGTAPATGNQTQAQAPVPSSSSTMLNIPPAIAQHLSEKQQQPLLVNSSRNNRNTATAENNNIIDTESTIGTDTSQSELMSTDPSIVRAQDVVTEANIPNRAIRDASGRVVMDMNLLNTPGTQYVTVTAPNGEQTRISRKFLPVLTFLNTGADNGQINSSFKQRLLELRRQLAQQASFVPSATNFLDIMELKELLQDK